MHKAQEQQSALRQQQIYRTDAGTTLPPSLKGKPCDELTKEWEPARILIVSHGHPEESLGGGEICAYQSFLALTSLPKLEVHFLFVRDGRESKYGEASAINPFYGHEHEYFFLDSLPNQVLLQTSYSLFDDSRFFNQPFKDGVVQFIDYYRPDIIHFHHYYKVGFNIITLIREILPKSLICLTLHDYKAICPTGHMVRKNEYRKKNGIKQLCSESSVQRCAQCCSERTEDDLQAREKFIRSAMNCVDLFFAPSHFLRRQYNLWGLPMEKIAYVENGIRLSMYLNHNNPRVEAKANRFAFFGRPTPLKGLSIFLQAIALLMQEGFFDAEFFINSDGLYEDEETYRLMRTLAQDERCIVHFSGNYKPSDLSERMNSIDWVVVPSVWWENSPIVIQEAFFYGRPVLCSNVGGMAEKVQHNIDGLHFEVGDPIDLAKMIRLACSNKKLWDSFRENIVHRATVENNREKTLAWYKFAREQKSRTG